MARKFLYVVAALVFLVLAGLLAFRLFGNELIRWTSIPGVAFRPQPSVASAAYDQPRMWFARPELGNNPAQWTPAGYRPAANPSAAVFFIHPTSYVRSEQWNASINDDDANGRAQLFLRGQASAFNEAAEVWAPRYRQATFGAFLTSAEDSRRALDLAYEDVSAAFESFLRQVDRDRPLILAGHSQGALHLTRLLHDYVARQPSLRRRVVAAYVVGWPVSRVTDLPRLGLPECRSPDQSGCLLSWLTFGEPADPGLITDSYDATTGFDGRPRRGTPIVCTNPLTGRPDTPAPAAANLGTLFPSQDLNDARIEAGRVPARCGGRGFLLIGEGPDVGPYVLPGNNYHVYDYSLFWANIRADAVRRLAAFGR